MRVGVEVRAIDAPQAGTAADPRGRPSYRAVGAHQWYSIAKIAGIMLAYRRQYQCDFILAMPTNLYGPNDNFNLVSGHVLPALLAKAHNARLKTSLLSKFGVRAVPAASSCMSAI